MVVVVRKSTLPTAAEAPERFRAAAQAAGSVSLREPRSAGFPLFFTDSMQIIEPAVAFLHNTVFNALTPPIPFGPMRRSFLIRLTRWSRARLRIQRKGALLRVKSRQRYTLHQNNPTRSGWSTDMSDRQMLLLLMALLLFFGSLRATADAENGTPLAVEGVLLNPNAIVSDLTVTAHCGTVADLNLALEVPAAVSPVPRVKALGSTYSPQFFYLYGTLPEATCTLELVGNGKALLTLPNVVIGGSKTTDIVVSIASATSTNRITRIAQRFEPYLATQAGTPTNSVPSAGSWVFDSHTPNPCFALHPPQGFPACMADVEPGFLVNWFVKSLNTQCAQNLELAQQSADAHCKGAERAECVVARVKLTQTEQQCNVPPKIPPERYFGSGVLWFEHPPYDPNDYSLVSGGVDPETHMNQHMTLSVCSVWIPGEHRQIIGKLLNGQCNYGWNRQGFVTDHYAFAVRIGTKGQWAPPYSYLNHNPAILFGPISVITGPSTVENEVTDHPFVCQGDFRREEWPFSILGNSVFKHTVDHGMHIGEVFSNGCGFEWGGFQTVGDGVQVYYTDGAPVPPAAPPHPHPSGPPVRNCSIPAHLIACGTLYAPKQYPGTTTNCPAGTHGVCVYETCTPTLFTLPRKYCAAGQ